MECFYIVTVGWIFSVCLHEFAHAWVAYRGGDFTVRDKGYLTFNPLKYTHPVYSFAMPILFLLLGGIGLPGGAVYINHQLLRSRAWETGVSLAGPAMNLAIIILIALLFAFGAVPADPRNLGAVSLAFLLQLQISALLLNLLPVPPLDGFQAIAPWLPEDLRERAMAASNVGMFALFVVLWYVPAANHLFWDSVHGISELMGVDRHLGSVGWSAFRFWQHDGI